MARIHLENVGLTFRVRPQGRSTLKDVFLQGKLRTNTIKVRALREINLHVEDGERVGILGHNGAGKSTLLRVLAGIYPPSRGQRHVEGQISSLFDIALGFEREANGWENICYRGYLQGETPRSIRSKMAAIADFSELGQFLDVPVRCYSAGMLVRLAFSIATAIDPEILLIDEVLSVGDLAFQNKAHQRMRDMMSKARLIVMVSHDLNALAAQCTRAVWLDHGSIRLQSPAAEVVDAYKAHVQAQSTAPSATAAKPITPPAAA